MNHLLLPFAGGAMMTAAISVPVNAEPSDDLQRL